MIYSQIAFEKSSETTTREKKPSKENIYLRYRSQGFGFAVIKAFGLEKQTLKTHACDWEMVQCVKHIKSHKHKDNSPEPSTHKGCQIWWHSLVTSVLKDWRGANKQTEPRISLDRQHSLLMSSRQRGRRVTSSSHLHTQVYEQTHACTHTCTHTPTYALTEEHTHAHTHTYSTDSIF